MWWVLGIATSQMTIEGSATVVRAVPPGLGDGWSVYGGDAGGNRYSSADQITKDNVASLVPAWTFRTGVLQGREDVARKTSFQTTPILVEESLVFCAQFNEVIALDPATGEEKWRYDPQVITKDVRPANEFNCRGVVYWQDDRVVRNAACATRVFTATVDARVIALDARTGQPCEDFGTDGAVRVEPSLSLRWPGEFQITSAPVIVGDTLVTGTAIGDNLRTKAPRGTVHAFDARTGAEKWVFNPVPINPDDPARSTWAEGAPEKVGHANVWTSIAVDEERGLVFLPTSSPSPDFYGGDRVGDNKYANSVVAVDGETGRVVWDFQVVHHDVWDFDLPAQPGLYQVWRNDRAHDVVAQVTKMGLVFVLDRETGEPFLPIEERPVPQDGVEGEVLSPTQPFPVNTPAVVPDRLNPFDAFGLTLWDKWACQSTLASLRAEGLYTPPSIEGTLLYPMTGGGANWGSAAFDPSRNLLVVNMTNVAHNIRLHPNITERSQSNEISHNDEFAPMEGAPYALTRTLVLSPLGLPCTPPPWGVIAGIDLASGDIVWRQTFGTTEDLAGGLALKLGTPNFGGPVVTASGLIFIGATMDNYVRALDVETGHELWKGRLPAGAQATPMTYTWEDRQYVVMASGGHGKSGTAQGDYIVAFALP